MKHILLIIGLGLISIESFSHESTTDLEIYCRPIKESEYFKAFSLRLRDTDAEYKFVKGSANASPAFEYIKTLEMHPQIKVTLEKTSIYNEYIKEITILSGDEESDQSAALKIAVNSVGLYYGRLQLWWPGQTSSLSEKVQCFLHDKSGIPELNF